MKRITALLVFLASVPASVSAQGQNEQGTILSAFFGLDNSRRIRIQTSLTCRGVKGGDGMPVIFSHEIDAKTLAPEDFQVTAASGKVGRVSCVTLRPADEEREKRTVLVIGEYGSKDNQPVKVEIIGDLMSIDGRVNFKGVRANVIPLEAGPTMILSETVPRDKWRLGTKGNCPIEGVKTVVRVTWTGGVRKPGGAEIDDKELRLYRVSVQNPDGKLAIVTPIAVADLNDNDNNHELCLGDDRDPVSVFFPAGALTDPNGDLNPDTEVKVSAARP